MKSGDWLGWIAFALTALSGIASVVFSFMLLLSDFALILAAIATAKKCFRPALFTYGLWFIFHFGLHRYHLALLDSTNHAHNLVVIEFVAINVIFVLGLLIGVVSLNKGPSPRNAA